MRFGEAPQGKLGDGVCDPDNNQELHSLVHYGGAPVSGSGLWGDLVSQSSSSIGIGDEREGKGHLGGSIWDRRAGGGQCRNQ